MIRFWYNGQKQPLQEQKKCIITLFKNRIMTGTCPVEKVKFEQQDPYRIRLLEITIIKLKVRTPSIDRVFAPQIAL